MPNLPNRALAVLNAVGASLLDIPHGAWLPNET